MPGMIDAHSHVGATKGLEAKPEFYTEENILDQLGLYARYGVTTVNSLGGDGEAGAKVRDAQETGMSVKAPLLVALTTPEPVIKSPFQVASALLTADIYSS